MPGNDREREHAKDARGRELFDAAMKEGLEQLVNFTTHTKSIVLDLLLINGPGKVIDHVSKADRLGHSHHCMIKVMLNFQSISQEKQSVRYNWNRANMDQIHDDMSRLN